MVTDTHFMFSHDGGFREYSRTAGSFGTSHHLGESDHRLTTCQVLYLQYDPGVREAHPYTVYPDRAFSPPDHHRLGTPHRIIFEYDLQNIRTVT